MKRKMIFGVLAFLLVLQAQAVFAQDYDYQFAEKFSANDIEGIEVLLKVNAHKMDLQICLNSVCHSLAWLTLGKNPYDLMERALPLNKNRNSIFKAIQFLVANGADLNQNKYKGLYTGAVDSSGFSLYPGNSGFSNILSWAIKENSQSNMAIIKFLLESGADPNPKSAFGASLDCLFLAIDQSNIQLVKLLIDAGCKVDETGWFLEDKYFKRLPENKYRIGNLSALQYATYLGEYAIVKILVEAGAKINYTDNSKDNKGDLASKTAAVIASERKETDIYNYLQSKQVASAPPPSSQPRQTYNDSYDYSPPPSNSSSSSTPSRNTGKEIADSISRAFEAPIENGRYRISGRSEEISFAGIAKSGMVYYKDATGKQYQGTYSIDGERLTINVMNKSFFYSITSKTSFSGHGEAWFRVGY